MLGFRYYSGPIGLTVKCSFQRMSSTLVGRRTRSTNQLPVIDASDLEHCKTTTEQIGTACNKVGAFYVRNHGANSRQLLTELQNFFGSSKTVKEKVRPGHGYFGYFSVGEEITVEKKDWKEGCYYRAEYPNQLTSNLDSFLTAANHWPDAKDFPNFKPTVQEFLDATKRLSFQISHCIADHLGLKKTFFTEKLTEELFQQVGLFRYPCCSEDSISSPWGVGPHSDPGFLVVVLQDAIGGLQIITKTGQWINVPPVDETLVVLVCDVAEVWTNGYCRSVVHRVCKPFKGERYSASVFIDPSLDCTVVPGEGMGNSNCRVDERLKELACEPFVFHDHVAKLYKRNSK